MSKLLTIDNCLECKYFKSKEQLMIGGYRKLEPICIKTEPNNIIDMFPFPSWCPLPDTEGGE